MKIAKDNFSLALGGLGGTNNFTAGVLHNLLERENVIGQPLSITATSGSIIVLYHYLNGNPKEFKNTFSINRPMSKFQNNLELLNSITKFRKGYKSFNFFNIPTLNENYLLNLLFPVKIWNNLFEDDFLSEISTKINESEIAIAINAYDPKSCKEIVYHNGRFTDFSNTEYRTYELITPDSIKYALWVSFYGYGDHPIDGGYIRQVMLNEHTNLVNKPSTIIVSKPQDHKKDKLPSNYFEDQDFKTELWMTSNLLCELHELETINKLLEKKVISKNKGYQLIDIIMLNSTKDQSYFEYFVEYDDVFDDGYAVAKTLITN